MKPEESADQCQVSHQEPRRKGPVGKNQQKPLLLIPQKYGGTWKEAS